ncbi:MAG: LamG-like jellyroll fold domain-containing protein [bacterium]
MSQAIEFNGTSSYVFVPQSTSLQPSNISIEAWIKPYSLGSCNQVIAQANGGCGCGWPYGFDLINGYVRSAVYTVTGQYALLVSTSPISVNSWYHIVVTYDGTTQKIYINGQLNNQNVINAGNLNYGSWAGDVGMGKKLDWCYPNYYSGLLDEVRIYNRALSASEIQNHYGGVFAKRSMLDTLMMADKNSIDNIPTEFALNQNHPNPFNPETIVQYALPTESNISMKIYNLLGKEIRTLLEDAQRAGFHFVRWDGKDRNGQQVASGVYLYRLIATSTSDEHKNPYVNIRKMIVAK